MGYLSIPNLYKDRTVLLFKEVYCLEKIHGTSAHITFHAEGNSLGWLNLFSGGSKHETFKNLFDQERLRELFAKLGQEKVIVYGEAYGGKPQGMKDTYGPNLKFVAFDVNIGGLWLSVPQAEDVVKKLGLEFVDYSKTPSDPEILDAERDKESIQAIRNGMGPGKKREGIVIRPLVEMVTNNGERVIAKHKAEAFQERRNTPKITDDPALLAVLEEASAIAEEWVVPMRLEHVLQKLPHVTGMEHTPEVVRAMIEDVFKEARGEISSIFSDKRNIEKAIGRKTALLWKKRVLENSGKV